MRSGEKYVSGLQVGLRYICPILGLLINGMNGMSLSDVVDVGLVTLNWMTGRRGRFS